MGLKKYLSFDILEQNTIMVLCLTAKKNKYLNN